MQNRVVSLDVFRGLTVMLMTLVNNPGDWDHIYAPFEHAKWHGCTLTDLVFPFFLFIVGVSIVLAKPDGKPVPVAKLITRTLRIFLLGFFLSFFSRIHVGDLEGITLLIIRLAFTALVTIALLGKYAAKNQLTVAVILAIVMFGLAFSGLEDFKTVRIPGVLPRIAVGYLIVGFMYGRLSLTTLASIAALLLVAYYAMMTLIPVPGVGPANLNEGTNLAAYIDNLVLPGHLWAVSKTWDPEGILSTIPAIATGIIGLLAGTQIRKTRLLACGGLVILILGFVWSLNFPLNKALWTSSFVCVTAGWALLSLAALRYFVDEKNQTAFIAPILLFGMHPMLVFFFSGIIPRALNMIKIGDQGIAGWMYQQAIAGHVSNLYVASLTGAVVYLVIWYAILRVLTYLKWTVKV
jgi:predicted acyltransferase